MRLSITGICIKNVYAYNYKKSHKKYAFLKERKRSLDIIIYFFMFTIGVVLGSFYTLAVYRIPLKQDITHTSSYWPKCNHKLNFWDLIPV